MEIALETSRQRFDRLLRPLLPDVRRFAGRLAPAEADDLLQSALERGLTHIDQLAEDGAFKVWLSRVVYTTWLNSLVKKRETPVHDVEVAGRPLIVTPPRPDDRAQAGQIGKAVRDALDGLPADQRAAVWLVDGQGHTFAEAAQILDVAPGTVASRVARGRATLRSDLAPWRKGAA